VGKGYQVVLAAPQAFQLHKSQPSNELQVLSFVCSFYAGGHSPAAFLHEQIATNHLNAGLVEIEIQKLRSGGVGRQVTGCCQGQNSSGQATYFSFSFSFCVLLVFLAA